MNFYLTWTWVSVYSGSGDHSDSLLLWAFCLRFFTDWLWFSHYSRSAFLNRPKGGISSYVSLFRMPLWSILYNSYDWCKWSKACSEGFWVRIVRYRLSGIVDGTLALCDFWRIAFQRVNAIILSSRPISNPICHRLILSGLVCKPSPAEANPIRSFGPIFPVGYHFKSSSLPSFRCYFLFLYKDFWYCLLASSAEVVFIFDSLSSSLALCPALSTGTSLLWVWNW